MTKVIIVSGWFDPVHIGHVRMFKQAAEMADTNAQVNQGRVIVALNSDEWLKRKKGKPFMPFEERKEILEIHLGKNNQPSEFSQDEWDSIVEVSQNFSGAELENVVQEAMYEAYFVGEKKVKPHHLINAISDTVPLAQPMSSQIEAKRAGAKLNCRMAQKSTSEEVIPIERSQVGRVVNF